MVLVILLSTVKFIAGPITGFASGLNLVTTILGTVVGTMISVISITYFGKWLGKRFLRKLVPRNRPRREKWNAFWKKYGVGGIAFLTPILLTPVGGAILAVSTGSSKEKIIFYMFISASVWSIILCGTVYLFGKGVLPDFVNM